MDMAGHVLLQLPEELLQDILDCLEKRDLSSLNLVSRWGYEVATPRIWSDVELVDCRAYHESEDDFDEHDDTKIIQKLLLFVNNPWLASCVQTLIHRCHLPPPAIFGELPGNPFSSQTLSTDPRTMRLVRLAAANMSRVHTLRVILGHPNLVDALLRSFFDVERQAVEDVIPVRKLWLENCRVSAGLNISLDDGKSPYGLPSRLSFQGLESVRLRRLPMRSGSSRVSPPGVVYSRGGRLQRMQDGLGGMYETTVQDVNVESRAALDHATWLSQRPLNAFDPAADGYEESPLELFYETPHRYDQRMYEDVALTQEIPSEVLHLGDMPFAERAMQAYRGDWLDPNSESLKPDQSDLPTMPRERVPSSDAAVAVFRNAAQTLTSINLDWVYCAPPRLTRRDSIALESWPQIYKKLFHCRFPHLRSFQWRNCVVPETRMPEGLFLLDYSSMGTSGNASYTTTDTTTDLAGLEFIEAHPGLLCLAWPMEHFFSHISPPADVAARVQAVVDNLGRTLIDLRVDTLYSGSGEANSEAVICNDTAARKRRLRFITEFAAKMSKCESVKIEGGLPRDERREIIRAMHACPLKKIVMIGVCSTIGNMWGARGEDARHAVENEDLDELEEEDKPAVFDLGVKDPQPPSHDFVFESHYGWSGTPPMLHTLASYHADTITELKFCGYKGSALLFEPTPITTPLFTPLKHFHNLRSLIVSLWLNTAYEGRQSNDAEVIQYWYNQRTPQSTALVCINDEEPEGWEKELVTKYAPDALAWRITNFIGPFLSDQAKKRKGGVHVRASFCVGDWGGIFDVDLHIGKSALGNVCLDFKGPREEFESGRRKTKLEGRRWF